MDARLDVGERKANLRLACLSLATRPPILGQRPQETDHDRQCKQHDRCADHRPARAPSLIFNTFHKLVPGDAVLLVNDHDPKPLYYQFQAELGEPFQWEYLERGPEVWKVRIGKSEKK